MTSSAHRENTAADPGPGPDDRPPAAPARAGGQLAVGLLAVATIALLAVGWVVSGALIADSTPPLVVATARTAGSCVTLAVIAAWSAPGRASLRAVARRPGAVAGLAFIGYFIYFGGTMLGVARIGASRTGLIVALLPCVTFVVGIIGFGERATTRKILGTLIAVGGAVGYAAATRPGHDAHPTSLATLAAGAGITLVATIAFAFYGYSYTSRFHDVSPPSALAMLFGAATLMLLPVAAATVPLGQVSLSQWLGSFGLGAILTAPVYITGHELFLRRGPFFVAAIALVVPFLVRLGDWGLGNASPLDLASLSFMALCIAGITAVVR
jgi:drug/metabolite transporter (DMT)-like permease